MKKMRLFAGAVAMIFCIAGCSGTPENTTAMTTEAAVTTTEAPVPTETETEAPAAEAETTTEAAQEVSAPDTIRIAALKGPTAMGLTRLMDTKDSKPLPYDFSIHAAIDEIQPLLIKGDVEMACVPANLSSVLFNKTEGEIKVLAVNTLGVLYIAENGSEVGSIADLKGKTIYSSGKGATPEFALNYLLKENGIDPENDVNIEWKSEHSECLANLLDNPGSTAMLPQPFLTTAVMKNDGINVAVDLNKEWEKLDNGSALLTGVIVGRKEFVDAYPEAVKSFLSDYAESVDYVNNNVPEAAALVEQFDIVPAAVATKALPYCNIVCITGQEMKDKLSGYLEVLFNQLPTSVGGAMPADEFYFIG